MATKPGTKAAKDQQGQDIAFEARRVLNNAVGFVKGQEAIQTFSALTFEDAMDQQIEHLVGDPGNGRPNQRERVLKTASELKEFAAKIKKLDPSAFDEHNEDTDVNTKK